MGPGRNACSPVWETGCASGSRSGPPSLRDARDTDGIAAAPLQRGKGETPPRQKLMDDSGAMKAEPRMQPRFSILTSAMAIVMVAAVLFAHRLFVTIPDREELGPKVSELRFEAAELDARKFAPLRLAGSWTVTSDDPRVGGISALAIDGGGLVALTDSGVVIRFAKPNGGAVRAGVRELPGGPGDPGFKTNRDSEALVRDPDGRGWWVAFETRNALCLYDPGFTRTLQQLDIPPRGLSFNSGIEGLTSTSGQLLLVPESGGFALQLGRTGWTEIPFDFPARPVADASVLPNQSLLVIERRLSATGFVNALVQLNRCEAGYCVSWRKRLVVAPLDNVEAIAVEELDSGGVRLWLMTDDNLHRPLRTLLIAADLPPQVKRP